MTKNLRFKEAREKSGLSQQEVADKMPLNAKGEAIKQSYIAQIEKDKGYSLKQARLFGNILGVSGEWLYFGDKSVDNNNRGVDNSTQQVKKLSKLSDYEKNIPFSYARNEASPVEKDVIQVPIVEKRARAGYVQGFADPEYMESLRKVYVAKQYEKGNYLVFEIDGNSMDDDSKRSICNGDVLLCKELDKEYWKNKLFYKRYLFIIVTNDEVLCKQIINHDVNTGKIVCHSFNAAYEDFELNLSEVNQLFYLVRIVERNIEI